MAALSAARMTKSQELGVKRKFPLAAVACYKGGLAMINSAGYVTPATASASNKGCVGIFVDDVDNSGGSAGDLSVEVQEGEFLFVGVGLTQAEVGDVCYASDDQTFSNAQASNEPQAGKLVEYVSATSGWIAVGAAFAS